MRSTAALSLVILFPLLPLPGANVPGAGGATAAQEADDDVPPWDFGASERNVKIEELMQGAWVLMKVQNRAMKFGATRGYALVSKGFMSIEFHGQVTDVDGTRMFFQSGTHSYELTQFSQLKTTSMIGTNNLSDPDFNAFERPGSVRQFFVTVDADRLELRRVDDGSVLSFRRINPPGERRIDFYGREVEPEKPAETGARDG